jgi:hypothetical protein
MRAAHRPTSPRPVRARPPIPGHRLTAPFVRIPRHWVTPFSSPMHATVRPHPLYFTSLHQRHGPLRKQRPKQLLDIAIDEFASSDYQNVSISRFVEPAGRTQGSFYQLRVVRNSEGGVQTERKRVTLGEVSNGCSRGSSWRMRITYNCHLFAQRRGSRRQRHAAARRACRRARCRAPPHRRVGRHPIRSVHPLRLTSPAGRFASDRPWGQ